MSNQTLRFKLEHRSPGGKSGVGITFANFDQIVVTAASSELRVWGTDTGILLRTISADVGPVTMRGSWHHPLIVVTSELGTMVWNVQTGYLARIQPQSFVPATFLPDGNTFMAAPDAPHGDLRMRDWDIRPVLERGVDTSAFVLDTLRQADSLELPSKQWQAMQVRP